MIGSWRPLQRVVGVRQDLVHHVDDRVAGGDEQALLAIRGEVHVAGAERVLLCAGDRLLTEALHVERDLPLAVRAQQPGVHRPHEHHVVQPGEHLLGGQLGCPRAVGLVVLAEHLHESLAHQRDPLDLLVEVGLAHLDRRVEVTTHPLGGVPPARGFGDPQPEHRLYASSPSAGSMTRICPAESAAVKWLGDICANDFRRTAYDHRMLTTLTVRSTSNRLER